MSHPDCQKAHNITYEELACSVTVGRGADRPQSQKENLSAANCWRRLQATIAAVPATSAGARRTLASRPSRQDRVQMQNAGRPS